MRLRRGTGSVRMGAAAVPGRSRAMMNETYSHTGEGFPKGGFLPEVARGVLDALPDSIFVLDLTGRVLIRNLAHRRLLAQLGLTPTVEELNVEALASLFEDSERFLAFVAGAMGEPEKEHEADLLLRQSGRRLSIHAAPVRVDEVGTVARLVVLRDGGPDRAEARRAERERRAIALSEARTPLTAIRGFVELVAERHYDEPTRRRHLEVALEQCDQLGRMLDELFSERPV